MSAEGLTAGVEQVRAWVVANVLTPATLGQIVVLVAAFALARMLAPAIRAWFDRKLIARLPEPRLKRIAYALLGLTLPVLWLILQWLAMQVEAYAGWPYPLLKVVASLCGRRSSPSPRGPWRHSISSAFSTTPSAFSTALRSASARSAFRLSRRLRPRSCWRS
jgi:hypothetical protein